jgi:hypothetical protein
VGSGHDGFHLFFVGSSIAPWLVVAVIELCVIYVFFVIMFCGRV